MWRLKFSLRMDRITLTMLVLLSLSLEGRGGKTALVPSVIVLRVHVPWPPAAIHCSQNRLAAGPQPVCALLSQKERTEAPLALGFGFVFNQHLPLEPQLPFGGGGREPEARVLEGTKT